MLMQQKRWKSILNGGICVITFVAQEATVLAPAFAQQGVTINGIATGLATTNPLPAQVTNANPNGQTTMASSSPVVPASDWVDSIKGQVNVTAVDCSGTIATAATAQTVIASSATLHGFIIANIDAVTGTGEPLWMSFTTTAGIASAASYPLPAPSTTTYAGMGSFTAPLGFGLNHAVSVIASTVAHKFSCTYW
jgi:hypothetical protein